MPISQIELLFQLVKSLTKAEKRNFKLYATRIQNDDELKYIQLFDILDKFSEISDDLLLQRLGNITRSQLTNLKRHLYSQILVSLRLIHINKHRTIEIREALDFATILYGKGLYLQSLKILDRSMRTAIDCSLDFLIIEIIELKKLIEYRHITRTGAITNRLLIESSEEWSNKASLKIKLTNFRILIHGFYIMKGHIKNENESKELQHIYNTNKPNFQSEENLDFFEAIYWFEAQLWYYYSLSEFNLSHKYADMAFKLFEKYPKNKEEEVDLYLRANYYNLHSLYYLRDSHKYYKYLQDFELYRKVNYHKFNENTKILSFLYIHNVRFSYYFLVGDFESAVTHVPRTIRRLSRYKSRIDEHKVIVLYYKIAWAYFGNQKFEKSIKFINKILQPKINFLRKDIQQYSRILLLMSIYEVRDLDELATSLIPTEAFISKNNSGQVLIQECINFFKVISNAPLSYHKALFNEFLITLNKLNNDPVEKLAFYYLDILTWVKSKVERTTMSKILVSNLGLGFK